MGLFEQIFGGGGQGESEKAVDLFKNLPLPVLKEYYPEIYKQVAELNPELETAVTLGPSEMAGISTDPALRQAQLNALSKLQEVGAAGGEDAQFLAEQSRLESDINRNLRGQQDAIMQNLATRGMSGGGQELVARQMSAQDAVNRQAQMAMDAKAQAQQRALQALMQSGQLSGQMQAQDFGQAAQKAQAADAIARFNAANQQDVIGRNVGAKNQAQQYNIGTAQDIANRGVDVKNQAQQYNLNLPQQQFENAYKRAGGTAAAYQNLGASKDAARDREAGFLGGLIETGARAAFPGGK